MYRGSATPPDQQEDSKSRTIPDLEPLLVAVMDNDFISKSSLHGEDHWKRVTKNGLWIADRITGADRELIFLFGLLHDCRRMNDGADLAHGPRAADAILEFNASGLINLAPGRLETLFAALRDHTSGYCSSDATIGACWDADRYDILRLFRRVKPELLSFPDIALPRHLDAEHYKLTAVDESWNELWRQVGNS